MALKNVLEEQIERNEKNKEFYNANKKQLPKGTIHEKKIKGKSYHYLKFRDSTGKRIDKYVKESEVNEIKEKVLKRKEIDRIIKELNEDIKLAKKALGRK